MCIQCCSKQSRKSVFEWVTSFTLPLQLYKAALHVCVKADQCCEYSLCQEFALLCTSQLVSNIILDGCSYICDTVLTSRRRRRRVKTNDVHLKTRISLALTCVEVNF